VAVVEARVHGPVAQGFGARRAGNFRRSRRLEERKVFSEIFWPVLGIAHFYISPFSSERIIVL
jgi:hypothetical protein